MNFARVDAALQAEIDTGRLPGAELLVLRDGALAHHAVLGALNPDRGTPMVPDAIFRIFSMTKPLTSAAVLMLMEDGRLQLTDPISAVLPEFSAPITIYDLLTHRSGLVYGARSTNADLRDAFLRRGLGVNPRDLTPDEFVTRLAQVPLVGPPGATWAYGPSTDLLGVLIERVAGQSLGDFLQARLFGPLVMVDTGFHIAASQSHRVAQPFARDPQTGTPPEIPDQTFDPTIIPKMAVGGAGAVSTAADYARFAQMLLAGGALNGVRVLSRAAVRLMTEDHLGAGVSTPGEAALGSPGYGFGLGVAVRHRDGGATLPGHRGDYFWSGTAGTTFLVDPAERLVMVFMAQTPGVARLRYRRLVRQLVYGALDD